MHPFERPAVKRYLCHMDRLKSHMFRLEQYAVDTWLCYFQELADIPGFVVFVCIQNIPMPTRRASTPPYENVRGYTNTLIDGFIRAMSQMQKTRSG